MPMMPPTTVRGKPIKSQMSMRRMMVVAGKACVEPTLQAVLLITLQTMKNGTVKRHAVSIMFHAQRCVQTNADAKRSVQQKQQTSAKRADSEKSRQRKGAENERRWGKWDSE